jgi:hypothetical protein
MPGEPTWPTVEQTGFLESRFPEYAKARTEDTAAIKQVIIFVYMDFNTEFPVHDCTIPSPEDVKAYSADIYDRIKGRKKVSTLY